MNEIPEVKIVNNQNIDVVPMEIEVVKQPTLALRILIGIIHGFIGLMFSGVIFTHGCANGNRIFELAMIFIIAGVCFFLPIFYKRKYRYLFLITIAFFALSFIISELYMNAVH